AHRAGRGRPRSRARRAGRLRVPELPAAALAHRTRERDAATGAAWRPRSRGAGARGAGEGRPRAPARPLPAPALGWRAATRGAGARVRDPALAAVRRRAHRQPRHPHRRGDHRIAVRAQPGCRHHPGAGDPRRAPGRALRPAPAPGQRPPGRRRMRAAGLAWRQLRRDIAAGDVRILAAALVLAVVAVTAVGFVTDRAERALALQANTLLGGDAVVRGDAPITGAIAEAAR